MTTTLFSILLTIFSVASILVTEAVKAAFNNANAKYSANLVALIVAAIVGCGGTAAAYLFLAIPFTAVNIVAMIIMTVAVWVGAMIGYDKLIQLVAQVKELFNK